MIAVGFSNGANIAGSTLLLAPGVLAGAVLLRAMVPIVPDPLPAIPGTPVLISNGRVDPLVPVDETERLAALLRSAGAGVTVHWHQAGHQFVHADISSGRVAERPSQPENQFSDLRFRSSVHHATVAERWRSSGLFVALFLLERSPPGSISESCRPHGQQLYQAACAACHGSDGRGQSSPSRGFDIEPPDLPTAV